MKLVTFLVRLVLEFLLINVSLVHQPNFSTLVLVGMLVLMDHQTIIHWEIRFAKPVTSLVRPVQGMEPINAILALHQLNFSTQILALLLVLTDHQTIILWESIIAKLVTLLVKPVLEMQRTNVSLAL